MFLKTTCLLVAGKDVICCKHINWLFHYQPLLA